MKKLSRDEFIESATKIHNSYNYDLVEYKNSATKVKVICNIHGAFEIRPNSLLSRGSGCLKCGKISMAIKERSTKYLENFIKTHDKEYNYDLVEYHGRNNRVKIICKIHGI